MTPMLLFNVLRKTCPKCKIEKSVALGFYLARSPRHLDGYMSWCRVCSGEAARKCERSNPAAANAYRARYARNLRERCLDKFGRVCAHCGFGDPRALQFDHVYNDGHKDKMRNARSRVALFGAVMRDTEGRFQLLCANCNTIKAFEYNRARRAEKAA